MGFFTGEEITPVEGRTWFPNLNYGFSNWISDQFYTDPNGRINLYGANAFNPANDPSGAIQMAQAYLQVPKNQRLANAWDAWQPWDAGTQYMANYITNGAGADPGISQYAKNTAQYGGIGGYGTDMVNAMAQYGGATQYPAQLLHNMVQYGGAGGPGNQAMSYAMQFGAPSQAGQFVANMAQNGIASQGSGQPLQNRAYGQQTPSLSYLQPFMNMAGRSMNYQSPSIPTRQLYRNDGNGPVRIAPPVGFNLPGPYGATGQETPTNQPPQVAGPPPPTQPPPTQQNPWPTPQPGNIWQQIQQANQQMQQQYYPGQDPFPITMPDQMRQQLGAPALSLPAAPAPMTAQQQQEYTNQLATQPYQPPIAAATLSFGPWDTPGAPAPTSAQNTDFMANLMQGLF